MFFDMSSIHLLKLIRVCPAKEVGVSIGLFVKTNTMWVIKTVIILNIREEKELPQRRSSDPEHLTRESDWVEKTDPKRGACLPTENRTWDQSCRFIHKECSINHHAKRGGVYTCMCTCVHPCTCLQTWAHAHTHTHTRTCTRNSSAAPVLLEVNTKAQAHQTPFPQTSRLSHGSWL